MVYYCKIMPFILSFGNCPHGRHDMAFATSEVTIHTWLTWPTLTHTTRGKGGYVVLEDGREIEVSVRRKDVLLKKLHSL